jgi:catecholate siderophore receptor
MLTATRSILLIQSAVVAALLMLWATPAAATQQQHQQQQQLERQAQPQQQLEQQQQQQHQQPQQPRRGQAREIVYVAGSLPYVPASNTIASKLPLSLLLTPFNVGIVTRALFEEQHSPTVAAALRNVSNVNIQPGNGVHDFFLIRGFDSLSSALVMTDGAAEPEATFYDLYNVENVEVLKGPGGFLYGSNPLAGTVNLVRKQPLPSTHVVASAELGRYDWIAGAVDVNYGNDDLFARVNALFRDSGGYRDRIEGQTFAINPAATWRIDDSASLNANFEYVSADYFPDSGIPLLGNQVPDVPRTNNYQSDVDRSAQDVYRLQADYQNRLASGLTIRNKLYYRGLDWSSKGTLFNGAFPELDAFFAPTGRLIVSRNLVLLEDRQNWLGNQLEALVSADTGPVHHDLVIGFDLARQADVFTLDVAVMPVIDLFDPDETFFGTPILVPGQSQAGNSRAIIAAPYIVDQIRFHDRFHALAGVRVDHIDFKDASISEAHSLAVARADTNASPMLGLVLAADAETSLYANYTRSFAPPAPRVRTGDAVPEEGEQIEVGLKRELLDRRARATVAVYQLERTNIGIPDANGITQQVGSQRSRGFEAELVAEPGAGVRLMGSYAYNDARLTEFRELVFGFDPLVGVVFSTVDRTGNRPAFAPPHVLNAWVSKSFARSFVLGGGARWVAGQFIAEDNGFVIDGVLTFDATASYSWQSLQIDLNIENLTNREYDRRGFGDASVTPADPLTVYAGVRFRR